jgi:hypothetical protein
MSVLGSSDRAGKYAEEIRKAGLHATGAARNSLLKNSLLGGAALLALR